MRLVLLSLLMVGCAKAPNYKLPRLLHGRCPLSAAKSSLASPLGPDYKLPKSQQIGAIVFRGVTAERATRLAKKLELKPGSILTSDSLTQDIRRLSREPLLDLVSARLEDIDDEMTLVFDLERPQIVSRVLVYGPALPRARRQKRMLDMFVGMVDMPRALLRTVDVLQSAWRANGYPDAVVRHSRIEQSGLILCFQIKPGPEVAISNVNVIGNTAISDEHVSEALSSWSGRRNAVGGYFVAGAIDESLAKIQSEYWELGYLMATLNLADRRVGNQFELTVKVSEGKQFRIGKMRFDGGAAGISYLMDIMKPFEGKVARRTMLQELVAELRRVARKNKYGVDILQETDYEAGVANIRVVKRKREVDPREPVQPKAPTNEFNPEQGSR